MSYWKVVVNFMLPPPLILTALLVLPTPRIINKGLLAFAKNVLFLQITAGVKLVHFMIVITALMVAGSAMHTHQLRQGIDPALTPNQRTAVMARIWREERNFWISVLAFLLWGLLYRFYTLMLEHLNLKDKVRTMEAALKAANAAGSTGLAPPRPQPPSAPTGLPAQTPTQPSAPAGPEVELTKTRKDKAV